MYHVVGPWIFTPALALPLFAALLLEPLALQRKLRAVRAVHGAHGPVLGEDALLLLGVGWAMRTMVTVIAIQAGLEALAGDRFELSTATLGGMLAIASLKELWVAYTLFRSPEHDSADSPVSPPVELLADAVLAVPAAFVTAWLSGMLVQGPPSVDRAFLPSILTLLLPLAVYVVLVAPYQWVGAWARRGGHALSARAVAWMGVFVIGEQVDHLVHNSAAEWQAFTEAIDASEGSAHFEYTSAMVAYPDTIERLCDYRGFSTRRLETVRITVGHMEYFNPCLTAFPGLREADFRGNNLRDFEAPDAPDLRILDLSHNIIQRFDTFDPLGKLGTLRIETLDLSHGNVQRCSPGPLGQHIRSLDLSGNPLGDCEFYPASYPVLERLILRQTGLSAADVAKIRRDLPHVTVIGP